MKEKLSKEELAAHIGAQIRKHRKAKKMTQKELGSLLGVGHTTVSSYEVGRIAPDQDMIFELANIFGVKVDELFPDSYVEPNDTLEKALYLANNSLDKDQSEFLHKLIERLLSLPVEEREDFLENLRFTMEYFDRKRK